MKTANTENVKPQRAKIEDLSKVGTELTEEQLQLASGGMRAGGGYEPSSCTANNDFDYSR